MSHPKHPATVHLPITTTLLTGGLDAVYFLSTYGPTAALVASASRVYLLFFKNVTDVI